MARGNDLSALVTWVATITSGDTGPELSCLAQALKSVPDDERDRAERKVKLRTLGNIRLIAELYKQDVVPEKILHACIQDMLGDGKSEPIEDNVEASPAQPDCILTSFCSLV